MGSFNSSGGTEAKIEKLACKRHLLGAMLVTRHFKGTACGRSAASQPVMDLLLKLGLGEAERFKGNLQGH